MMPFLSRSLETQPKPMPSTPRRHVAEGRGRGAEAVLDLPRQQPERGLEVGIEVRQRRLTLRGALQQLLI